MTWPVRLCETFSKEGGTTYRDSTDAFIDTLVQRLTAPVSQQGVATRTSLVGMSVALALVSLVALACLTYLFLSMGTASISAAGMQVGAAWARLSSSWASASQAWPSCWSTRRLTSSSSRKDAKVSACSLE